MSAKEELRTLIGLPITVIMKSTANDFAGEVTVQAGRFTAVKTPHRNGTVWVSDKVPALGIVKGDFPDGQLELVKQGTAGAQDLLRS